MIESAKKFGVELKDMQMKAVLCCVGGMDTFVSLPTGYGKSLIWYSAICIRQNQRLVFFKPQLYSIILTSCLCIPVYRHFQQHSGVHQPFDIIDDRSTSQVSIS